MSNIVKFWILRKRKQTLRSAFLSLSLSLYNPSPPSLFQSKISLHENMICEKATHVFRFSDGCRSTADPCIRRHRIGAFPGCFLDFRSQHWCQCVISMTEYQSAHGWIWWPCRVYCVSYYTRMHTGQLACVRLALDSNDFGCIDSTMHMVCGVVVVGVCGVKQHDGLTSVRRTNAQ